MSSLESCCFGPAELLYEHHVKPADELDRLANLISQFLPIYEIDSPTEAFIQFLRIHIFVTINVPRLPAELKTSDVEAEFEKKFGFSLKIYSDFMFFFSMHAMIVRGKKSSDAAMDCGIRLATFQNMKAPAEMIEKMFDNVSFSLDALTDQKAHRDMVTLNFSGTGPTSDSTNNSIVLTMSLQLANLKVASCGGC
jgi:hypothetical protein